GAAVRAAVGPRTEAIVPVHLFGQVAPVEELGKVRGTPAVVASRSALSTVLRRGVAGARAIGGNELFDVRTRLDQTVRFV
ncbi:MAG: DegT/DnrJ/EryC1/StrS family aminotransferase, partial [Microbacterium sp.]|nr:DegT/DnrJ/EryC1/StrS family aminotransferase [Microbacterium sp.]